MMIEKILSYFSVFVIMAMLSVDKDGTNVGKSYVNDTNSYYFRESAKFMINYLSNYKIDDPALRNRAKIFMEKLEKDKNMQGAVAEIISTVLDEFNIGWLNSILAELATNEKKTLEIPEDSFYEEDCIEDKDGKKCGGTAPPNKPDKGALGVIDDIKVQDYMEPSITNKSLQEYYYGDIIHSPMEKEKFDKNKLYRKNVEDSFHELADTGYMAYQDVNIFDEDPSDIKDNTNLEGNRIDDAYPFNFMQFGNTDSTTEGDEEIFYTHFKLSHKEESINNKESINNEGNTSRNKSENISNAEPQKIAEINRDYFDKVTNYVMKSYEDKISLSEGNENPESNERKSDHMNKAYFYETYDGEGKKNEKDSSFEGKQPENNEEEMSENHPSFLARKILEYNEEGDNHTNLEIEMRLLKEKSTDYYDFEEYINMEYRIDIPLTKVLSRRKEHNRVKRSYDPATMLKGCPIPPSLETAQGYCKSIPSKITCHLYCVKGYTYSEGIRRTIECSPDKGWDNLFEECKPYADCTLKLRSGGTLSCALTTATKNAQCYVSCEGHGLYLENVKRLYECNSLGLWTPVLPHCVVREGIDLVEPPSVVEHGSIDYP